MQMVDASWAASTPTAAQLTQALDFAARCAAGFLAAFADAKGGIMRPESTAILATAPTPAAAARLLTLAQLRAQLREADRSLGIDAEATRLREAFRQQQMRPAPPRRAGNGPRSPGLLRRLDAACRNADDLEAAAIESLTSTRTPGSSPASQASARSPVPECSPR